MKWMVKSLEIFWRKISVIQLELEKMELESGTGKFVSITIVTTVPQISKLDEPRI